MATKIIPMEEAPTLANFYLQVALDGTTYQLTFTYNSRSEHYFMSIDDASGNNIRAGIKVVINWPLLRTIVTSGRPLGELIALDNRETDLEPAADPLLEDLGNNVVIAYVEEESLP